MSANVTQNIVTRFQVAGASRYQQQLQRIGGASQMTGQAISRMTGMLSPLRAAIVGAVGGFTLAQVAAVGAKFEDARRSVAGMFATFGMARDFNQGLRLASQTIKQIEIDSAKLPGEAEDYIQTYRAALPGLQAVMRGNNQEMVAFSNKFTAAVSTMGIQGYEAAAGLSRMLSVGRGTIDDMNPAFRSLLPYITTATEGTRDQVTSVSQFNKLTQDQRYEILRSVVAGEGITAMLKDAEMSWTAQSGTIKSITNVLFREGTSPLFKVMTEQLARFNGMLMDGDGKFTKLGHSIIRVGRTISEWIGEGIKRVVDLLDAAGSKFDALSKYAAPFMAAFGKLGGGGMASLAGAGGGVAAGAMVAGGGAMAGPAGALVAALGAGMAGFLADTAAVGTTLDSLSSVASSLAGYIEPVIGLLGSLADYLGGTFAVVIPHLAGIMAALAQNVVPVVAGFIEVATSLFNYVRPALVRLIGGVTGVYRGFVEILAPVIRLIGHAMLSLYEAIGTKLIPIVRGLISGIAAVLEFIGESLRSVGKDFSIAVSQFLDTGTESAATRGMRAQFDSFMNGLTATTEAQQDAAETMEATTRPAIPGARGGGKTVQDFRFSRFDIAQKFAEGFDPDRIAVAFAQDLGRVGEQRLQSGMEPAHAIR